MRGQGDEATMRILVADQEPELLEALARVFEIDVATSKATCIDLLRANDFDVVIATEKLNDGSGLELLSQVAKRWPRALRIFSIEPTRRALLRGRLGPFKLFEIVNYPFDPEEIEAALLRAAESLGENAAAAEPESKPEPVAVAPVRAPAPPIVQPPARASAPPPRPAAPAPTPKRAAPPPPPARAMPPAAAQPRAAANQFVGGRSSSAPQPTRASAAPAARTNALSAPMSPVGRPMAARPVAAPNSMSSPRSISLPRRGSKVVPLGSPDAGGYRILPHDYHDSDAAILRRSRRDSELDAPAQASIQTKAAKLATNAMSAMSAVMSRITTSAPSDDILAPQTGPRKKR